MIRVENIKLSLDDSLEQIVPKITKRYRLPIGQILSYRIIKEAIDARDKKNIKRVYTVDIEIKNEEKWLKKTKLTRTSLYHYEFPKQGEEVLHKPPVIIGAGPCGLFAALLLAQKGYCPIVIERGQKVEERVKTVEKFWKEGILKEDSNVQFGEGGAGTFSDGKLTTQIKNKRCQKVLEEFVAAGAPAHILYKNKPHIGTDILQEVVKNIRETITRLGGKFFFDTKVTDFHIENGKLKALELNHTKRLETDLCVLAIGHSARDTFEILYDNKVVMKQKPFAIGMRIEHLQDWINEMQYGPYKDHPYLGAAEYKLVHHCQNGRTIYSFCMCPGGYVIASASETHGVVTNGMSEYKRDAKNANSALLMNVGPDDYKSSHPLAGVELQRKYEKLAYQLANNTYGAPVQKVGDFLENKQTTSLGEVVPTYQPSVVFTNLRQQLPTFMGDAFEQAIVAFGKKMKGFDHPDAILTGFETRSSSPVRIKRNEIYESNIKGIYPAGEGAGYAGGITSAAVDGIEVAEAIIKQYKGAY